MEQPNYHVQAPTPEAPATPFIPVSGEEMTGWDTHFSEENLNHYYKNMQALIKAPYEITSTVVEGILDLKKIEIAEKRALAETQREQDVAAIRADLAAKSLDGSGVVKKPAIVKDPETGGTTVVDPESEQEEKPPPGYGPLPDPPKQEPVPTVPTPDDGYLKNKVPGSEIFTEPEPPTEEDLENSRASGRNLGETIVRTGFGYGAEKPKPEAILPENITMSTPMSSYQWLTASAIGAVPNAPKKKLWTPGNENESPTTVDFITSMLANQPNIDSGIGRTGETSVTKVSALLPAGEAVLEYPHYNKYVKQGWPDMPTRPGPAASEEVLAQYTQDMEARAPLVKTHAEQTALWEEARDKYKKQKARIKEAYIRRVETNPKFQEAKPYLPEKFPAATRWFMHRTVLGLTERQFKTRLAAQTQRYDSLSPASQKLIKDQLGDPRDSNIKLHIAILPYKGTLYRGGPRTQTMVNQNIQAAGSQESTVEVNRFGNVIGVSGMLIPSRYAKTVEDWKKTPDEQIPISFWEIDPLANTSIGQDVAVGLHPMSKQIVEEVITPKRNNRTPYTKTSRVDLRKDDDGVSIVVLYNKPRWSYTKKPEKTMDTIIHEGTHAAQSNKDFRKAYEDRDHEIFAYFMGRIMSYRMTIRGDKSRPLNDAEIRHIESTIPKTKANKTINHLNKLAPDVIEYLKNMIVFNRQQPTDFEIQGA